MKYFTYTRQANIIIQSQKIPRMGQNREYPENLHIPG